ncbi:MAG TPA: hypothetical protein VGN56_01660 [Candidatus Paceibacterota bacterium]|jgi:hypothetical protein|nr:hypothetical protein [Candidatus Paceibacterota bacterium]
MGDMTDPRSLAKEERALAVFNSVTRSLDRATIERIRNGTATTYDRGFISVREAISAWDDVLRASDGVIEMLGKEIHMPL